jgi:hypothetical protein
MASVQASLLQYCTLNSSIYEGKKEGREKRKQRREQKERIKKG